MIRCVRLWSDAAGRSHVEHGTIAAPLGSLSAAVAAVDVRFEESPPHAALDWHTAPHRQLVLTLTGHLEFVTRDGEQFVLEPGLVLLAEDTVGTGHQWSSVGEAGWRRAYVVLGDAAVPFVSASG